MAAIVGSADVCPMCLKVFHGAPVAGGSARHPNRIGVKGDPSDEPAAPNNVRNRHTRSAPVPTDRHDRRRWAQLAFEPPFWQFLGAA
ncbi:hypothetical protein GCM10027053_00440 [Intrasporangium mesophilum]